MSAVGLEGIERTVQLTHIWINDLDERLGWDDKRRSYRLLRAVLQSLRDWLPINEAADMAAQLPELLRGAFYEHWRPGTTPVRERSKAEFLRRIVRAFEADPTIRTEEAVTEVFALLGDKISTGEIEQVRHALPPDIRAIWADRVAVVPVGSD